MRSARLFLALLLAAPGLAAQSCAYRFQTSENPLAEKEGIRRIYVASVSNNTYKPGVENLIYNAVQRTLSAHRRVVLVSNPEEADALLQGTVEIADSFVSNVSRASAIDPNPLTPVERDADIAAEYTATLRCGFLLVRRDTSGGKKGIVWTGGFNRTKPFQTAFLRGVAGTTTALINDSEFDRILSELAVRVAEDLHESMLAMF